MLSILGAIVLLRSGQVRAQAKVTWNAGRDIDAPNSAPQYDGASADNCDSKVRVPVAASSAGFKHLVFCDDFDSISTIDVKGTGAPGFNWYTKLPFGWGQTLPSGYSVSHSVLTVTSMVNATNWGLTTRDPVTGNGHAWNFGFFEARVKFDPTLGPRSKGWPSFWAMSAYKTQYDNPTLYPELDFFEAYTGGRASYSGVYLGTLHQWQDKGTIDYFNSNDWQTPGVEWNKWHVLGCLWIPGRIAWYLDGNLLITQKYSATAPPNPLAHTSGGTAPTPAGVFDAIDSQIMQPIVGSSPGWPLYIDWVRVWRNY
ncbi:MAG: LamG domain-containing protein [Acidobacteriaceae bacterium]